MAEDVRLDQLAVIRIEGMHCHQCEKSIQQALSSQPGVREVEVDFASGQASILFTKGSVSIERLMDAVNDAGYRATGFTQNHGARAPTDDHVAYCKTEDEPDLAVDPELDSLLNRPLDQRRREFKYRFAQAVIFGAPVLALQWLGRSIGGSPIESDRWVAILQLLLCGWITYVGAAGMLAEGLLVPSRRMSGDTLIAVTAAAAFLFSAISAVGVFAIGRPFDHPLLFAGVVILLIVWCGWRWWQLGRADSTLSRRL